MCHVETLFFCSALLCKSAEHAEPPSSNISGRHWHPKWIKEVPSIPATGLGDDIIALIWTHRCDLLSMMLSRLLQIPTKLSDTSAETSGYQRLQRIRAADAESRTLASSRSLRSLSGASVVNRLSAALSGVCSWHNAQAYRLRQPPYPLRLPGIFLVLVTGPTMLHDRGFWLLRRMRGLLRASRIWMLPSGSVRKS